MKKTKRTVALASAALALCMAPLSVSCGGKPENRADTLYVATINNGYGTEWLYGMLEGYCEKNPGMRYEITPVYSDKQISDAVEAGAGACNYDLIVTGQILPCDPSFLADLTDVYNYTYESGSRKGKTVKEAMEKSTVKSMTERVDGSSYKVLSWSGSVGGLLVNEDVVGRLFGENWRDTHKIRTTDELLVFCEELKQKNMPAFMHAAETNTQGGLLSAWFAQYNGVKGVENYNKAIYEVEENGEVKRKTGVDVVRNEGTLKALEAFEDIFGGGYSHKDSNGIEWDASQTRFMLGESAIRGSGDWFMTEMGKQYPNVNLSFNKIPVISALGEKWGITDAQLASLIDYVDAVNRGESVAKPSITSTKGLDIDTLIANATEARAWNPSSADFFTVGAVNYSTKLDTVKDFLKYMVSDEGQYIYTQKTKGLTMSYGYNLETDYDGYADLPVFAKSRWEIVKNVRLYFPADVTTKYGAKQFSPFAATSEAPIEVLLSRKEDRWTAQEVYDYDYTYYSKIWSTYNY